MSQNQVMMPYPGLATRYCNNICSKGRMEAIVIFQALDEMEAARTFSLFVILSRY